MPEFVQNVTSAGTPVQATPNPTSARTVLLIGAKSLKGPTADPNTGTVRCGFANDTNKLPLEIAKGAVQSISVAEGCIDLSQLWIDAVNSGDGLVFFYV